MLSALGRIGRPALAALAAAAAGLFLAGNCLAEEMSGHDLAVKMDQVDTSKDNYSAAVMTINRNGKTLTRTFKSYSKHFPGGKYGDDEYSLIVFDSPPDVNGTKYLIWSYRGVEKDDDMWIYLPAESLVRRISGSSKFASFMRSDLSNEDVQNMDDVEEYDYNFYGSEVVDGIDCWKLERIPKAGKVTDYSRQMQWVRKDNLLRYKIDAYDKKGKLVKKFHFQECKVIDGIPSVVKLYVEHPEEGTSTLIEWPEMRYDIGLEDGLFQHSQLKR